MPTMYPASEASYPLQCSVSTGFHYGPPARNCKAPPLTNPFSIQMLPPPSRRRSLADSPASESIVPPRETPSSSVCFPEEDSRTTMVMQRLLAFEATASFSVSTLDSSWPPQHTAVVNVVSPPSSSCDPDELESDRVVLSSGSGGPTNKNPQGVMPPYSLDAGAFSKTTTSNDGGRAAEANSEYGDSGNDDHSDSDELSSMRSEFAELDRLFEQDECEDSRSSQSSCSISMVPVEQRREPVFSSTSSAPLQSLVGDCNTPNPCKTILSDSLVTKTGAFHVTQQHHCQTVKAINVDGHRGESMPPPPLVEEVRSETREALVRKTVSTRIVLPRTGRCRERREDMEKAEETSCLHKKRKRHMYKDVFASKLPALCCEERQSSVLVAGWRSPQDHLNAILSQRGYPLEPPRTSSGGTTTSTNTGTDEGSSGEFILFQLISPLQRASFGTRVVRAVHESDPSTLSSLLDSGLSPNPCNSHGDSVLNMVCKRGRYDLFSCLVGHGATLRTVDGFGRTPLHHAAWASAPNFAMVEAMLDRELDLLFVTDKQGKTPLEYITRDRWVEWVDFLDRKKDQYWPAQAGAGGMVGESPYTRRRLGDHRLSKNGFSVKKSRFKGTTTTLLYPSDPTNALPVDLAAKVANGTMEPKVAVMRNRVSLGDRQNNADCYTLASPMT